MRSEITSQTPFLTNTQEQNKPEALVDVKDAQQDKGKLVSEHSLTYSTSPLSRITKSPNIRSFEESKKVNESKCSAVSTTASTGDEQQGTDKQTTVVHHSSNSSPIPQGEDREDFSEMLFHPNRKFLTTMTAITNKGIEEEGYPCSSSTNPTVNTARSEPLQTIVPVPPVTARSSCRHHPHASPLMGKDFASEEPTEEKEKGEKGEEEKASHHHHRYQHHHPYPHPHLHLHPPLHGVEQVEGKSSTVALPSHPPGPDLHHSPIRGRLANRESPPSWDHSGAAPLLTAVEEGSGGGLMTMGNRQDSTLLSRRSSTVEPEASTKLLLPLTITEEENVKDDSPRVEDGTMIGGTSGVSSTSLPSSNMRRAAMGSHGTNGLLGSTTSTFRFSSFSSSACHPPHTSRPSPPPQHGTVFLRRLSMSSGAMSSCATEFDPHMTASPPAPTASHPPSLSGYAPNPNQSSSCSSPSMKLHSVNMRSDDNGKDNDSAKKGVADNTSIGEHRPPPLVFSTEPPSTLSVTSHNSSGTRQAHWTAPHRLVFGRRSAMDSKSSREGEGSKTDLVEQTNNNDENTHLSRDGPELATAPSSPTTRQRIGKQGSGEETNTIRHLQRKAMHQAKAAFRKGELGCRNGSSSSSRSKSFSASVHSMNHSGSTGPVLWHPPQPSAARRASLSSSFNSSNPVFIMTDIPVPSISESTMENSVTAEEQSHNMRPTVQNSAPGKTLLVSDAGAKSTTTEKGKGGCSSGYPLMHQEGSEKTTVKVVSKVKVISTEEENTKDSGGIGRKKKSSVSQKSDKSDFTPKAKPRRKAQQQRSRAGASYNDSSSVVIISNASKDGECRSLKDPSEMPNEKDVSDKDNGEKMFLATSMFSAVVGMSSSSIGKARRNTCPSVSTTPSIRVTPSKRDRFDSETEFEIEDEHTGGAVEDGNDGDTFVTIWSSTAFTATPQEPISPFGGLIATHAGDHIRPGPTFEDSQSTAPEQEPQRLYHSSPRSPSTRGEKKSSASNHASQPRRLTLPLPQDCREHPYSEDPSAPLALQSVTSATSFFSPPRPPQLLTVVDAAGTAGTGTDSQPSGLMGSSLLSASFSGMGVSRNYVLVQSNSAHFPPQRGRQSGTFGWPINSPLSNREPLPFGSASADPVGENNREENDFSCFGSPTYPSEAPTVTTTTVVKMRKSSNVKVASSHRQGSAARRKRSISSSSRSRSRSRSPVPLFDVYRSNHTVQFKDDCEDMGAPLCESGSMRGGNRTDDENAPLPLHHGSPARKSPRHSSQQDFSYHDVDEHEPDTIRSSPISPIQRTNTSVDGEGVPPTGRQTRPPAFWVPPSSVENGDAGGTIVKSSPSEREGHHDHHSRASEPCAMPSSSVVPPSSTHNDGNNTTNQTREKETSGLSIPTVWFCPPLHDVLPILPQTSAVNDEEHHAEESPTIDSGVMNSKGSPQEGQVQERKHTGVKSNEKEEETASKQLQETDTEENTSCKTNAISPKIMTPNSEKISTFYSQPKQQQQQHSLPSSSLAQSRIPAPPSLLISPSPSPHQLSFPFNSPTRDLTNAAFFIHSNPHSSGSGSSSSGGNIPALVEAVPSMLYSTLLSTSTLTNNNVGNLPIPSPPARSSNETRLCDAGIVASSGSTTVYPSHASRIPNLLQLSLNAATAIDTSGLVCTDGLLSMTQSLSVLPAGAGSSASDTVTPSPPGLPLPISPNSSECVHLPTFLPGDLTLSPSLISLQGYVSPSALSQQGSPQPSRAAPRETRREGPAVPIIAPSENLGQGSANPNHPSSESIVQEVPPEFAAVVCSESLSSLLFRSQTSAPLMSAPTTKTFHAQSSVAVPTEGGMAAEQNALPSRKNSGKPISTEGFASMEASGVVVDIEENNHSVDSVHRGSRRPTSQGHSSFFIPVSASVSSWMNASKHSLFLERSITAVGGDASASITAAEPDAKHPSKGTAAAAGDEVNGEEGPDGESSQQQQQQQRGMNSSWCMFLPVNSAHNITTVDSSIFAGSLVNSEFISSPTMDDNNSNTFNFLSSCNSGGAFTDLNAWTAMYNQHVLQKQAEAALAIRRLPYNGGTLRSRSRSPNPRMREGRSPSRHSRSSSSNSNSLLLAESQSQNRLHSASPSSVLTCPSPSILVHRPHKASSCSRRGERRSAVVSPQATQKPTSSSFGTAAVDPEPERSSSSPLDPAPSHSSPPSPSSRRSSPRASRGPSSSPLPHPSIVLPDETKRTKANTEDGAGEHHHIHIAAARGGRKNGSEGKGTRKGASAQPATTSEASLQQRFNSSTNSVSTEYSRADTETTTDNESIQKEEDSDEDDVLGVPVHVMETAVGVVPVHAVESVS